MELNRAVSVVLVPARVDSVEADWCFADVAGDPAVRHLAHRIRKGLPDLPVVLVCSDDRTADLLHQTFDAEGTAVWQSAVADKAGALAEFCRQHGDYDTLLLFHPHSLFPDCEITHELVRRHKTAGADATVCLARPRGYVPEIIESRAVERVNRLKLPVNLTDDIVGVMKRAGRLAKQYGDDGGFTVNEVRPDDSWPDPKCLPAFVLTQAKWSLDAAAAVITTAVDLGSGSEAVSRMKEFVVRNRHCGPVVDPARYRVAEGRIPVLFMTSRVGYSGAEESFSLTITHLDRNRFHPFVVLPLAGKLSRRLEAAGIQVEILHEDMSLPTLRNVLYCRDLLAAGKFRIVHINGEAGLPIALAAKELRIPLIHHVRKFYGLKKSEEWKSAPEAFVFSTRNIAISDAIADDLLHHDIDPAGVVRIYNGVELDRFRKASEQRKVLRRDFGLQGKKVITMIARICEQKRQEELLKAMPSILERIPEAVLLLVGEVDIAEVSYDSKLKKLIGDLGIADSVVFWGFEQYIERVHAVSDVMVLCTRDEPFGRCILEAMAAGVPVVVPSRSGPTEIVENGVSGQLYDTGDCEHLADCICTVLSDSETKERLIKGGRERVKDFSIERHSESIARLYEELLTAPQKADTSVSRVRYSSVAA